MPCTIKAEMDEEGPVIIYESDSRGPVHQEEKPGKRRGFVWCMRRGCFLNLDVCAACCTAEGKGEPRC